MSVVEQGAEFFGALWVFIANAAGSAWAGYLGFFAPLGDAQVIGAAAFALLVGFFVLKLVEVAS